MSKTLIASICGAILGVTSIITVADISSTAVGGYSYFDHWFSNYWGTIILFAGAPGAAICCALFFGFLCGIGFLRVSAAVGIAGGAIFGFIVGPPDSWIGGDPLLEAIIRIFWELLMGGIGGIVGWLIEKLYDQLLG